MAAGDRSFGFVYKCIQAAYVSTEILIKEWDTCINNNYDTIKSFLTYVDQWKCVRSIDPDDTTDAEHKAELTYVIAAKISEELIIINKALSILEDIARQIERKLDDCVIVWNKNCSSCDISKFVLPNGIYPHVSELILSLQEIYLYYRNEYLLRMFLVESWDMNDEAPRLMTEWPVSVRNNRTEIILMNMRCFAKLNTDEIDALTVEEELEECFSRKLSISEKSVP